MRKKKEPKEKLCRNCGSMPNEHNLGQYDDLMCEMERLPAKTQELYNKSKGYVSYHGSDLGLRPFIIYYPMDNLEYLEYEYERANKDVPTRESLR